MKDNNGAFIKEGSGKLFEKKPVRIAACAAAAFAALFALNFVAENYGNSFWWARCTVYLPLFLPCYVVLTAGLGGIFSNIGEFGARKFIKASAISAAVFWALVSVSYVAGAVVFPLSAARFWRGLGASLLEHLPLSAMALGVVIVLTRVFTRIKQRRGVSFGQRA